MFHEYEVKTPQGVTLTMRLSDETAKKRGLKRVDRKGAAPVPTKSRRPRNKAAAPDVASASDD